MKKLLSVLVSLTLLLALTAPALAEPASDVDLESVYVISDEAQAWMDAHPQASREFHADIDAYIAEEWSWYSSVAEMAEEWGESEEYIRAYLTEEWVLAQIAQEEWDAWVAQYTEAHPGTLADLEASAYDYFAREYTWYDSAEEYMADFGYTEEEFIAVMVEDQLYQIQVREERNARLAEYEAAHPGALADLSANAYDYFAWEYPWYDSAEEYMACYGYTEEEFIAAMVDEQIYAIQVREENLQELEQLRADLGGVPGQMGVMLNGQYLTFPDAVPETVNGRIMVPYRALMEALGGDVAYDEATQTVSCILGGTTLTLKLGESSLTVNENGTISTLEMDCAAYAHDGRTYVPVRFISQAFGYDVLWDQGFETAVLVDRKALAAEIDSQFTVLNRALDNLLPDPGQAQSTTGTADAQLTLFDSIAGDQIYQFSASGQSLTLGAGSQGEIRLDLSALREIVDLDAIMEDYLYWDEPEQAEIDALNALIDSLDDLSLEMIVNGETGDVYLRSPLLGLEDERLTDAWLVWHSGETLTGWDELTVGAVCCQIALAEMSDSFDPDWIYSYLDYAPVMVYGNALTGGQALAEVLGDGCFTHTDAGDVFTLDPALLDLDGEYSPFSELEFTFTVADSGAVTGSFTVNASGESLYGLTGQNSTALLLTGSFDLSAARRTLTLDLHMKNTFRLELEATAEITPAASVPLTAPPAGDVVIDAEEDLSDLGI